MSKIPYNLKTVIYREREYFVEIHLHCSATFSIATTWLEVWKSLSIAELVIATFVLFTSFLMSKRLVSSKVLQLCYCSYAISFEGFVHLLFHEL